MTTGSWVRARDFPPGTPLRHFFAWNEAARVPDRRYVPDLKVVLAEAMALVGHCPGSAQREASTGVADGMASSPGITS